MIKCRFGFSPERVWAGWGTALRKVAGSIPNGVTGIFHWLNPSGPTMSWGRLSL